MKKLLLFLLLTLTINVINAQSTCATAVVLSANGNYTSPAITGAYANNCYTSTTTGGGLALYANWYSFTPTATGEVTLTSNLTTNVAPLSVDTKVSIFTGTCSALVCYDYNDDTSSTNYLSTISFPVVANTTYYIAWDNYWDAAGFDFTFTYTENSCVMPYYVNALTNLTTTSASLSWEASVSNPSQYDIEYGLSGYTQGSGTVVNVSGLTYDFSGLTASAVYDYYIRSNCGGTQSAWNGPFELVLAKSCPYSTSFDSNAELGGWTTAGSGTYGLGTTAASAQSGSQYLFFGTNVTATNNTAANNWFFTPPVLLSAGETVTTKFWAKCASARKLRFTVGNDNSATAQTTQIWSNLALTSAAYSQITTPTYVAPTTGLYYFGFNDISVATTAVSYLRIDTFDMTSVLGTNEFLNSKFAISPNPANDFITLSNTDNIIVKSISMTDLNGRVVKQVSYSDASNIQVNVSDLASGMYLMNITSDQGTATKKVVIN